MKYQDILQQAIDLHIHVGPEIIPRKFDLPKLLKSEKGRLKGVGVKNHFFATSSMTRPLEGEKFPFVVDSVVLNNYVGGFNPDIIYASAQLSPRPIIVWLPTLSAMNFLRNEQFEIRSEWIGNKKIKIRKASGLKGISIWDKKGEISGGVKEVLLAIKKTSAILATGHISWQESRKLADCAIKEFGIKKIIITHPIYPKINMPICFQKELANKGALIEQCYSMYSIDKISIAKIANQIRSVGAKNCILTSDVGQKFSKSPSEALDDFIALLIKEGISEKDIKKMAIMNPNRFL